MTTPTPIEKPSGKFWVDTNELFQDISDEMKKCLATTKFTEFEPGLIDLRYKFWCGDVGFVRHRVVAEIVRRLILNEIFNLTDYVMDLMINLPAFVVHEHEIAKALKQSRIVKPMAEEIAGQVARTLRLPG